MSKRKTTEQFIIEAKQIHGDKYDYSKVNYSTARNKIIITCPIHGDFEQIAFSHLTGRGCIKCGYDKFKIKSNFNTDEQRLTTEEFIYRATLTHQDDYDYSKVDYVSSKEKVIITCKQHGDFEQIARNHLKGQGCPKCAFIKRKNINVSKAEKEIYEFLNKILNPEHYDL